MGVPEIEAFLSLLNQDGNVSASIQNQAFNVFLFLFLGAGKTRGEGNAAESHTSGARCVGRILNLDEYLIVVFPIIVSVDTKLHTILGFLEMQFYRKRY